jgi:hypothetical protein
MNKVIEIQVRVMDEDENGTWSEDSAYIAERICLTFEADQYDCVEDTAYAEADELKEAIHRIVTA